MRPRHDHGIDAGRVSRSQARAEVARVLDLVENEQTQRTRPCEHECLELAYRKFRCGTDIDHDALMTTARGTPIELGTAHVLDLDAEPAQFRADLRKAPPGPVEQKRPQDRMRSPLNDRMHGMQAVDSAIPRLGHRYLDRRRRRGRGLETSESSCSTGAKSILRSSRFTFASRTRILSVSLKACPVRSPTSEVPAGSL